MSIALILVLLAAILFGVAAFARTPYFNRLVASGLFCLALAQLLGMGILGIK